MTTNEPTTGEIVRALREDCNVLDYNVDKFAAADRLESQEKTIAELTARAEQAEAREKAAVADIPRMCIKCSSKTFDLEKEPCMSCFNNGDKPNWTWRGLPQEGEGKK